MKHSTLTNLARRACLAAFAGLALAATAASAADIKIGGVTFITGKFGTYGQDAAKGMKLGVEEVNASGGVLGRKLELDLQDTASESSQAALILRKFAATSDVVGVVGPTGTPDFLTVLPLTAQLKVPVVAMSTQRMDHDKFSDWIVRVIQIETPEVLVGMLKYAKDKRNAKKMAVLFARTNDFAQAQSRTLAGIPKAQLPLDIVATESYAEGDKDFAAVLDKVLRAQPDLIWLAGSTAEVSLVLQQARARQYKGLFMGTSGVSDPKIYQLSQGASQGLITMVPFDVDSPAPLMKKFVAAYRKANGDGPIGFYTAYSYDSVRLLADAIKRAGSTDRDKVMKALGQTKNFEGVTGTYSYNGKGDNASSSPYLVEVSQGGTLKAVR